VFVAHNMYRSRNDLFCVKCDIKQSIKAVNQNSQSVSQSAVLTNHLGSSLPLGSEYVPLETWDDGAQRLLTLKTSRRRLVGQPTVGA